jgi:hypothetical protein
LIHIGISSTFEVVIDADNKFFTTMNKIAGSFEDGYEFGNSTFSIRKMILPRKNKDGLTKVMIEVRQHKYTGTGQYQDIFKRIATDVWILPMNWHKKKN